MTAKPFLITGLPRSRTAWMSVFCTTGPALCYHEPIARLHDITGLASIYDTDAYQYLGVSDSTLSLFLDWILANIKPRTLIIERDKSDVEASVKELGLPNTNLMDLMTARMRAVKDHPLVMWVPFEALNSKRVMQKIFWHLMPGAAFDEDRYENMKDMHIEVDFQNAAQEAKRNQVNLNSLLRDILPLVRAKGQGNEVIH